MKHWLQYWDTLEQKFKNYVFWEKYTNIIENFTCDHSNLKLKFYDKLIGDGLRTRKHSLLPGGLNNNGNEQE